MAESEGMGAFAGYMLGRASVQQEQFLDSWTSRFRGRSGPTFEQLTHELLAQREALEATVADLNKQLCSAFDEQQGLKQQLSEAYSDLAGQKELTRQWKEYGSTVKANYQDLKEWADYAENSLKRYKALYGPLPPEK